MKIIKITSKNFLNTVNETAKILKSGGLIVYPTDTAYGIGVNALNTRGVKRLYDVKERGLRKPTHTVVRDWDMIKKFTYPNLLAKKLYDKLLPGPLTIILNKKKTIPDILNAGLPTLGIRIPKYKFTQSLSKLVNFPYTTPSANRSGEPTPYSIEDVRKVLNLDRVDLVVDAGILPPTPPSTIVDSSKEKIKILRNGPVTQEVLRSALSLL